MLIIWMCRKLIREFERCVSVVHALCDGAGSILYADFISESQVSCMCGVYEPKI